MVTATSVRSLRGGDSLDQAPRSASASASTSAGASTAAQRQYRQYSDASSVGGASTLSALGSGGSAAIEGAGTGANASLAPKTPPLPLGVPGTLCTLSPADAVALMRDFASEVASEVRLLST